MENHIYFNQVTRNNFLKILDTFSTEQLHTIPEGYNNSVFWNIAHAIASQQAICYLIPKLEPVLPVDFIKDFRKGTAPKPEHKTKYPVELLKEYMYLSSEAIKTDIPLNKAKNFEPYSTELGAQFSTIEDAFVFSNIHEGLHLGYIIGMKRHL